MAFVQSAKLEKADRIGRFFYALETKKTPKYDLNYKQKDHFK